MREKISARQICVIKKACNKISWAHPARRTSENSFLVRASTSSGRNPSRPAAAGTGRFRFHHPRLRHAGDETVRTPHPGRRLRAGHFVLPQAAWWSGYYDPMEARLTSLRGKHAGDAAALAVIAESQREIDLYRFYSSCYGYVFYTARKV
jgi:hypothetical protein